MIHNVHKQCPSIDHTTCSYNDSNIRQRNNVHRDQTLTSTSVFNSKNISINSLLLEVAITHIMIINQDIIVGVT